MSRVHPAAGLNIKMERADFVTADGREESGLPDMTSGGDSIGIEMNYDDTINQDDIADDDERPEGVSQEDYGSRQDYIIQVRSLISTFIK